jgi:hypothetical protein
MHLPRHRRHGRADGTPRPAHHHLPHISCGRPVSAVRSPDISGGGSASDPGAAPDDRGPAPASAALAASVSETPDAVRLHIQASGDVELGSVEVRFAGRKAVVLARDAEGRAIRSQPLRLPEPVVEEGSSADYYADGALVVTLRKQATAQDAGPTGDPEAAAR